MHIVVADSDSQHLPFRMTWFMDNLGLIKDKIITDV